MKLIFSFLFISPALAESSGEKAAEEGGSALLFLLLLGFVVFVVYRRWRGRGRRGKKTDTAAERVMARAAEPEAESPPIVVKTYKGTRQEATRLFQTDAVEMADLGYVPTTQSWAQDPTSWVRWGGITLNMQPQGALTVTYARQTASTYERQTASVEEKTCPQCAERIKAAAVVCRFCGYKFVPSEGAIARDAAK